MTCSHSKTHALDGDTTWCVRCGALRIGQSPWVNSYLGTVLGGVFQ